MSRALPQKVVETIQRMKRNMIEQREKDRAARSDQIARANRIGFERECARGKIDPAIGITPDLHAQLRASGLLRTEKPQQEDAA